MFFITRAIKYLRKKLGKTALLVIIFIVIANFVLAGLLVQNAANEAQKNTRQAIGADINYQTDYSKMMADINSGILDRNLLRDLKGGQSSNLVISEDIGIGGGPTLENFTSVIVSEYIESVSYSSSFNVVADLLAFQTDSSAEASHDFKVIAYGAVLPESFMNDNAELLEGRLADADEIASGSPVIIIEDGVADLNNLEIGDTLAIEYTVNDEIVEIDHEIIGIYDNLIEMNDSMTAFGGASIQNENRFYTPFNIVKHLGYSSDEINNIVLTDTIIRLNDPNDLDAFRSQAESIVNMNYGKLDANDDLYNNLVGPLENLGLISSILVTIIVVTGGLIIGLITALTISDRKGEIGILLAVGESKIKIVSQFVLEVVLIAVVAFSLSMFTGQYLGEQISEGLLESDLIATSQETQSFGMNKQQKIAVIDKDQAIEAASMTISIAPIVLLQVFGLGVVLTVVSTIIPSLYVMRFNPKQILISRES